MGVDDEHTLFMESIPPSNMLKERPTRRRRSKSVVEADGKTWVTSTSWATDRPPPRREGLQGLWWAVRSLTCSTLTATPNGVCSRRGWAGGVRSSNGEAG